jgi:hypothetical protein
MPLSDKQPETLTGRHVWSTITENHRNVQIVILIYPPIAKACDPPGGIAKLAGAASAHGIETTLLDANLESIYYLLRIPAAATDRWTLRAERNLPAHLSAIKTIDLYGHVDRYRRAVSDINRVLEMSVKRAGTRLTLADYQEEGLSPVKSADLLYAAEHPEISPFYTYFSRRLQGIVSPDGSGLVGLSVNYLSQALPAFAMAGFMRRRFPDLTLVMGGGLITSWIRAGQAGNPFKGLIDHLIAGPGEAPLLDLLGMAARPADHHEPLFDALPLKDYLAPGIVLPYTGSVGCYWNRCSFCPERAEGNPYVPTAPEVATREIRSLATMLKPILLHLTDNAISPALMRALSHDPPGVPWYGFARITPLLADRQFCSDLRKSGCVMLKLGLESGNQGVLDNMEKGLNLGTASTVFRTLKAAGLATYVYLLFGTPRETIVEARETLNFVAAHANCIDFLNLAIFNLPVNSPEARGLDVKGFYEGDLSLYQDFVHPEGWGRREIRQFLDHEFRTHPAMKPILHRNPPFFTSNHAPFFVMKEGIE